ncbi:catechol 2,3-dioxygenase-like lactoylglutathione lyase family enzyme [Phycicoccus badiiscoriae]|uniref:Catechol 2,3-dioxygenase-like lactoylglutathione lyase family enzyme n=1 Tax=Pedococcus badiiscoriae TaxID=642776 RepID=A0A852W9K6_9MICO|nr:VOC family protein [Pedococcus badiiscoriae]NYG05897.1 catechol 2,3-dioxygenase-like lactoylglutathione lyase family enzyme [Pedococcus badiiscoriae]
MPQRLSLVTLLVRDYDEAIAWFLDLAGFELVEDTDRGDGTRWVVVRPGGSDGTNILLARASTPEQEARVGDPGGGRVMHFLATDDFAADHARMVEAGVRFRAEPRHETYGDVVVFEDLYGNAWDLIQPR